MLAKSEVERRITDLIRCRNNTERFLKGFLNFTLSQKPPFPESWLGFNLTKGQYQFTKFNKIDPSDMGKEFLYYPNGYNAIYYTDKTNWIAADYTYIMQGKRQLEDVVSEKGELLHSIFLKKIQGEIAFHRHLIGTTSIVDDIKPPTTPLF